MQDAIDEADETIVVDIDAVTNGTGGNAAGDGHDRGRRRGADGDAELDGQPAGGSGRLGTVTATLSAASGLPVTVTLAFSGTATLTDDYTRSGTSITIAAGDLSGSVTLTAVQDRSTRPTRRSWWTSTR